MGRVKSSKLYNLSSLSSRRIFLNNYKPKYLSRGLSSSTEIGLDIPNLKDFSLARNSCFVNNEWFSVTASLTTFQVIDPSTEQVIAKCPDVGAKEANKAIICAHDALHRKDWASLTCRERHDLLMKLFGLMREHESDLANIITRESGKPINEAITEVKYASGFIEWFAEESLRSYGDVIPSPDPKSRYMVVKQPIGVVAIITPWNFPLAMITRKMGAALAAGCTVVIKPAAETPLSALAMGELIHKAGFAPGVVNIITSSVNTAAVGEAFCTSPLVNKISFTGSTVIGKKLMAAAACTLKKMSLELGGNAPFIVFDDADLEAAADGFIKTKFRNAGQTCVCPNRLYVQSKVYNQFVDKVTARMSELKVGPGKELNVTVGPLITAAAREKVMNHVEDAVSKGAVVRLGGKPIIMGNQKGVYYAPTILTGMKPNMLAATEETFGPVVSVFKFESEEDAISLANATEYGLAAYAYTQGLGRAFRVAEKLQSGMVAINSFSVSTHCAPFGGIKESGIGREGSKYGLDEYTEKKFISMTI